MLYKYFTKNGRVLSVDFLEANIKREDISQILKKIPVIIWREIKRDYVNNNPLRHYAEGDYRL